LDAVFQKPVGSRLACATSKPTSPAIHFKHNTEFAHSSMQRIEKKVMGIFKKSKGIKVGDGEKTGLGKILEDTVVVAPVAPAGKGPSPKSKRGGGLFKGNTMRKGKKRNKNFQRLSSSFGSPVNFYEPPQAESSVFFADDGSVSRSSAASETIHSSNEEHDSAALTSKKINVRPSKYVTAGQAARKKEGLGLKDDNNGKEPVAVPFQKMSDEESLPPKGARRDDASMCDPPSMRGDEDTLDITSNNGQPAWKYRSGSSGRVDKYDANDFDNLLQAGQPFSDLVGSSSSGSYDESPIDGASEAPSAYEGALLKGQGRSSYVSAAPTEEKFSEAGSSEFHQFIFDKSLTRIENVKIEKSDSGAPDPFMSAAAKLTSKLSKSKSGFDKYSRSPCLHKTAIRRPVANAGSPSEFPSPRFPSPAASKRSVRKNDSFRPTLGANKSQAGRHFPTKVSDDQSESTHEESTVDESVMVPPKAIVTSSDFTVVSNMSATQATAESRDILEKHPQPHFNPFSAGIPEDKEEEDENDPFRVGALSEVDDTLWGADDNPFKYKKKVRKSNNADDSLIASIKKAKTRDNDSTEWKPDPSPKSDRPSSNSHSRAREQTTLRNEESLPSTTGKGSTNFSYSELQRKEKVFVDDIREHCVVRTDENKPGTMFNAATPPDKRSLKRTLARPSPSTPERETAKPFLSQTNSPFSQGKHQKHAQMPEGHFLYTKQEVHHGLPFSPSTLQNRPRVPFSSARHANQVPYGNYHPVREQKTMTSEDPTPLETSSSYGGLQASSSGASNPSGVPSSAIMASMLFRTTYSDSTRTLAQKGPPLLDEEEETVVEDSADVPFDVDLQDHLESVSSITEEASTFYQKSFQLWSKTASTALNSIQRGGSPFPSNPNHYGGNGRVTG